MSDRVTVITMPQPTVNGPLHLGHLSGPYVAADIAARAARANGSNVVYSTGLDVSQNYVSTRADQAGIDPAELLARFRADITGIYDLAGLSYDNFIDPQAPDHARTVNAVIDELIAAGTIRMRDTTLSECSSCARTLLHSYVAGTCRICGNAAGGGCCEGCGAFTSAENLDDARCTRCDAVPRPRVHRVPVLRMADFADRLATMWVRAVLPPRVRALVTRQVDVGLPDIPVAYPTDWGIEGTGAIAGLRVDPYTEVAISDLYGIARAIEPDAADLAGYRAAWQRVEALWHYHGIDNAFAYGLHWPALWSAAGLDPLPQSGLVVNEFYTLDGSKFSTSRNHAIWGEEILEAEDRAIVRLYLAWDRPDRYGSDFTWRAFHAFRDHVAPLLAGDRPAGPTLPAELLRAERRRAEDALRPESFDAALAARGLLTLLAAGADPGDTALLRAALTGG